VRFLAVAIFAVITAVASTSLCQGEPTNNQDAESSEQALVGQLLLPPGSGSRGVEVVVTVTEAESEPRRIWILFDEEGRFSGTFPGRITRLIVSTGLRSDLYRIETEDLPEINQAGQLDVGVIDLRDQLVRHRLILRVAEGASQGEVRVAMFFGLPPVGPFGEPVALGSRQFPPVVLGSEVEWLLPLEAESLYFLVERPVGSTLGGNWRSGYQRLFGPFTSDNLPTELTMD